MPNPIPTAEELMAAVEEAEPTFSQKYLYPYDQNTGELNWAWMATTMGAAVGVGAVVAQAKLRKKDLHPAAAVAAVLIGGWIGAKTILPA